MKNNKIKFTTTLKADTLKKLETIASINGLNINQVIDIITKKQKRIVLY